MKPLTDKQQAILEFIQAEIKRVNRPPTVREIAERFGYQSPNTVTNHLMALEKKQKIRRQPNASRGIEVLAKPPRGLPLVTQEALSR